MRDRLADIQLLSELLSRGLSAASSHLGPAQGTRRLIWAGVDELYCKASILQSRVQSLELIVMDLDLNTSLLRLCCDGYRS